MQPPDHLMGKPHIARPSSVFAGTKDMNMRNFDFSPLYRTTVGFDHLSTLLDSVNRADSGANGYPPYNIELLDTDQYQISMAVAGFAEAELNIQTEKNTLLVKGVHQAEAERKNFLHRGIAARNFERRFQLADHVEVTSARLTNGLLYIELLRKIPDAMQPKNIPIGTPKATLINTEKQNVA
ncbi:MAG: molecular chaperone IbpA [Pseudohongiellaceae bacterium]